MENFELQYSWKYHFYDVESTYFWSESEAAPKLLITMDTSKASQWALQASITVSLAKIGNHFSIAHFWVREHWEVFETLWVELVKPRASGNDSSFWTSGGNKRRGNEEQGREAKRERGAKKRQREVLLENEKKSKEWEGKRKRAILNGHQSSVNFWTVF